MNHTADAACGPAPPLLAADEAPPFERIEASGSAPFLLVCDHASRTIPRALGDLGLDEEARRGHIAWDVGAAEVTRRLAARFDAPAVLGGYSRLVIDLNRPLDDPTSIPVISEGKIIPGNRGLSAAEARARAETLFLPYHGAVAEALEEVPARGTAAALVSVHSFTPVYKGERRPWHVGVMWDRDPRLAVPFMERLRTDPDIRVGENLPYSARDHYTFTADHHAARAGRPHLVVEIRADLLETPGGVDRWTTIVGDAMADVFAAYGLEGPEGRP